MGRGYEPDDEPVPGYRLEKFLGEGAFGQVWRAVAPGGTEAALKIISLSGKQGLKEFRALRLVKGLRHPNLVPIFAYWLKDDAGHVLDDLAVNSSKFDRQEKPAGDPQTGTLTAALSSGPRPVELIIAMGLGEQDLTHRLEECRQQGLEAIPAEELLGYIDDAARAIDFLNNPRALRGSQSIAVQHCDIKPSNIMIVGGAAQVCDFGLARMLGDVRKTSTAAGSIAYVAPECLATCEPSTATDQYSLAVTYIELRTGKLPYRTENFADVTNAVLKGDLDLSRLSVPEQDVLRRATALDPSHRYATTTEMVQAVRTAVSEAGNERPAWQFDEAHGKRGLGLAVAAVAVVGILVAWLVWGDRAGLGWADLRTAIRERMAGSKPEPAEPPEPALPVAATTVAGNPPAEPAASSSANPAPLANQAPPTVQPKPPPAPSKPTALARGRALFEKEKFDEAVAALTEAIKASPQPPAEAWLLRGTAFLELGKNAEAITDFTVVLKRDPDNGKARSRRATAYLRQGEAQAAIDDFTRAIEAQPDARDYIGRAMAFWNAERDPEAIADLTEALKLAPMSGDGHYKRGLVYLNQEQWLAAKEDFAAALELDPENPDLLATYARLLATAPDAKLRSGTLAVELATKAGTQFSSPSSDFFDTLAAAYAEAGQFDEAVHAAETAVAREQDPATKQEYTARLILYQAKRPYHVEP